MDFAKFPSTALEFESRFATERACWEFLWEAKWPDGFVCRKCGGSKAYYVIERALEECAACGHQASVTAGTMFHCTRKPLRWWFRAIFEFVSRKHGCNAMDIQRLLGLSYQTSWEWLHKIREAFVRPGRERLRGEVEVDETIVGGPEPGVIGRDLGAHKQLIAGAVEVTETGACGRTRLAPVESGSAETLQAFVVNAVEDGSLVCTDGLPSYEGLKHCYDHQVTVIGDPKTASQKFPCIHRVFSLFKRVISGTYHGSWSKKYAPMYCEEFDFRFNRRRSKSRVHLFRRVIEHGVLRPPRLHLVKGLRHEGPVTPEAA